MFRLHLESRRSQSPAFHLDEAAWKTAAIRHADLSRQVQVSFGWDGEWLEQALSSANALLASKFDKAMANAAPHLQWIHTTGAGVDQLMPLADLREDIILSNSSGIHSDKSGESALMAILMLNARLPEVLANQQRRHWDSILTRPIAGKNLVLIGFGDIGQAVARKARALGLTVSAVTRSGTPLDDFPEISVVTADKLDALLPDANFVVVTAPLTSETRGMLSAERLARLPDDAGIVNMARSALVDYPALVSILREGRFAGAVLDVFPNEPLEPESAFWDVPRLIVSPHITCDAPDYNQRVLDLWFRNFAKLVAGEPMDNRVDRARGY
jgi:phosphoglycerate dehydrogenase-like enzyme